MLDNCPFLKGVMRFDGCPPAINSIPSFNYRNAGSGVRLMILNPRYELL